MQLTPRDATMYWLSARTRNDLFLLYCFTDTDVATARLGELIATRSLRIPDLRVHVRNLPANLAYPMWSPCEFTAAQFVEHHLPTSTWSAVTEALPDLLDTGLDAADRPWRLHIFRGVMDAPLAPTEPALVAVLQLSHALADGRRAAEIARTLFTEEEPTDPIPSSPANSTLRTISDWFTAAAAAPLIPVGMARTIIRGLAAYRAQRDLAELTAAGQLPPPGPEYPPNPLNGDGGEPAHAVRMIVRATEATRAPSHTVTTVVLTAVSLAVQRYLEARDEPITELGAQVPMAVSDPARGERNSYHDLAVDLAVQEPDLHRRAEQITANLAERRTRATHPLQTVQGQVTAAIPAPILHRDVSSWPIALLPEKVSGHTVVSSVHRGPADLTFGGGAVRFTAGFPALGSVMHLTHGVHGLGDTVTVSIHADPAVIPDLDVYATLLEAALDEVVTTLGGGHGI